MPGVLGWGALAGPAHRRPVYTRPCYIHRKAPSCGHTVLPGSSPTQGAPPWAARCSRRTQPPAAPPFPPGRPQSQVGKAMQTQKHHSHHIGKHQEASALLSLPLGPAWGSPWLPNPPHCRPHNSGYSELDVFKALAGSCPWGVRGLALCRPFLKLLPPRRL